MMKPKIVSGSLILLIALFVYFINMIANEKSLKVTSFNHQSFAFQQSYYNSGVDPAPPPPFPPPPPSH